jgi:riboflavin kinase/FMN adenylyltransferase
MQVAHFPDFPRPGWVHPVVALGNFDGVHRGHMKLLDEVRRQAGERGGTPVAMVFEPHPPRVLRPDKAPPLLMTLDQKLEAFQRAGMQGVAIVRFTRELSRWEPELFVDTVLVDWLRVAEVWVGANFVFGRDRSGTFTLLRARGDDAGFRTGKIEPVRYKEFVVSSTRIRHLVAEGRVDEAAALLGHHYFIDGVVVRGDGRGRGLGFPTANLRPDNELLPANGIYATIAWLDDAALPAVTSIGVRPTIGDGRFTVETHILEPREPRPSAPYPIADLYGRRLRLAFVKWLRPEAAFDGLEPLRVQIARDCQEAWAIFERMTF